MKSKNFIKFRSNKYNSSSCNVDGHYFHSRREADYYGQLKIEKRAGLILDFERQVSFDLMAWNGQTDEFCGGKKIGTHVVDFLVTLQNGSKEVREVKGYATDLWDYKRKIFEANYPDYPYKVVR